MTSTESCPNRNDGFISSIQRMVGKLGDILSAQKSSPPSYKSSPAIEMAIDPVQLWSTSGGSALNLDSPTSVWDQFDDNEDHVDDCLTQLSRLIEYSLREAKDGPLRCGEVLLPAELTSRVARDVIRLAENEPCGLRGCLLLIHYEDHAANNNNNNNNRNVKQVTNRNGVVIPSSKRIGLLQYDPGTVATFELLLTLRKDLNTWTNLRHFLPFKACLRKFGSKANNTIIVSPVYTLVKRKLYRSSSVGLEENL